MNTQVILSIMKQATKRATWPGVRLVNVTDALTRFRQRCESEAEQPAHEITVNLCEVLSDIAICLEVGQDEHDRIIGPDGIAYLTEMYATPIKAVAQ